MITRAALGRPQPPENPSVNIDPDWLAAYAARTGLVAATGRALTDWLAEPEQRETRARVRNAWKQHKHRQRRARGTPAGVVDAMAALMRTTPAARRWSADAWVRLADQARERLEED
jgi:hypothetical protein